MNLDISGTLALDASVLIDLLLLSERGKFIQHLLLGEIIDAHTTELAIVETEYILCRKIGWKKAKTKINKLIASGYIVIEDTEDLISSVAYYKCNRSISLADSLVLALAKKLNSKALFSHKEREIVEEINKEKFDIEILFLDDVLKSKQE